MSWGDRLPCPSISPLLTLPLRSHRLRSQRTMPRVRLGFPIGKYLEDLFGSQFCGLGSQMAQLCWVGIWQWWLRTGQGWSTSVACCSQLRVGTSGTSSLTPALTCEKSFASVWLLHWKWAARPLLAVTRALPGRTRVCAREKGRGRYSEGRHLWPEGAHSRDSHDPGQVAASL